MRVKSRALDIVGLGGLDDFVMIGVASDCLLAFGVDTAGDLDIVAEGGFGGNWMTSLWVLKNSVVHFNPHMNQKQN